MAETIDPASVLGSIASLLRPELAELAAYAPHDPGGIEVKLDANEAPSCPAAVRETVARALASVSLERYPDPRALRLKEAIAKRTGARVSDLLVGTGSDEVIGLVVNALAQPRRRNTQAIVLTPTPTFVMYRATARSHGAKPVEVPLDTEWDLDVPMMRRALQIMEPSIVFIASPNNPTGNAMSRDRVEKVLEHALSVGGLSALGGGGAGNALAAAMQASQARAGSDGGSTTMVSPRSKPEEAPQRDAAFTIVDEAYVDYAGKDASVRDLRAKYPHLGILRTVSKIGLAALRIGWLEADASLVAEIEKTRQPFNTSATSQAAVAAVLEEAWDEVQAGVARVVESRELLADGIRGLPGFSVTQSASNFLWVKTPVPAERVFDHLVRDKILVRSFHKSGGRLASQLRITVGTDSEHARLLASLSTVGR